MICQSWGFSFEPSAGSYWCLYFLTGGCLSKPENQAQWVQTRATKTFKGRQTIWGVGDRNAHIKKVSPVRNEGFQRGQNPGRCDESVNIHKALLRPPVELRRIFKTGGNRVQQSNGSNGKWGDIRSAEYLTESQSQRVWSWAGPKVEGQDAGGSQGKANIRIGWESRPCQ